MYRPNNEGNGSREIPSKRDAYKRIPAGSLGMGFFDDKNDELLDTPDAIGEGGAKSKTPKKSRRGRYGRLLLRRMSDAERNLNNPENEPSENKIPTQITKLIEKDIDTINTPQEAHSILQKIAKVLLENRENLTDREREILEEKQEQLTKKSRILTTEAQTAAANQQQRSIPSFQVVQQALQEKAARERGFVAALQQTKGERSDISRDEFRRGAVKGMAPAVAAASSLWESNETAEIVNAEFPTTSDPKPEVAGAASQVESAEKIPSFDHLTLEDVEKFLAEYLILMDDIQEKLESLHREDEDYEEKKREIRRRFGLIGDHLENGNQEQIARKREIEQAERFLMRIRVEIVGLGKRKKELTQNIPPKSIETKENNFSEIAQKEFGLKQEDLRSLGFEALGVPQQALVLQNLRQLTLGRIHEEAEDALDAEMSKKTEGTFLERRSQAFGKIWKGFSRSYQIAKKEKETAEQLRTGGVAAHGETLKHLIEIVRSGPNVSFDEQGKVQVDFLDVSELEFFRETKQTEEFLQNFQTAAKQLASIPCGWNYPEATKEQREAYQDAKQTFESSKWALIVAEEEILRQPSQLEEFLQRLNTAEYHIEMQRFFNQYPDADQAIIEMADQSAVTGFFKKVRNNFQVGKSTEATAQFTLGYVGRSAAAYISAGAASVSLVAFPVVGGIMGGWSGWRRAKENLLEQDKKQRLKGLEAGRASELKEEIQKVKESLKEGQDNLDENERIQLQQRLETLKEELKQELEKTGQKNFLQSSTSTDKLQRLLDLYDSLDEEDEKKKAQVKAQIQSRINYTRKKLEDGLISFDGKTVDEAEKWEGADAQAIRMGQQMQLLSMLARAEAYVIFDENYMMSAKALTLEDSDKGVYGPETISEDWATRSDRRLGKLLSDKEQAITEARTEYKKKMLKKGALMGAGFALAGATLREALANGFFDWANHVDTKAESVTAARVTQEEKFSGAAPKVIPTHIDIKIPLDAQHISGKSIEGEIIERLVRDGDVSSAEAGKLAHRAVLAFAKEHHLGASQLHQLDHIRSADLDMRIINGHPEILSLDTIPARGHEAIHISRMALSPSHSPSPETLQMTPTQRYIQTFREMLDSVSSGSVLSKPELLKALRETSSADNEMIEKIFGKNFDRALLFLGLTFGIGGYSMYFRRKKSLEQVMHEVSDLVATETDPKKREELIEAVTAFEEAIKKRNELQPKEKKRKEKNRREQKRKKGRFEKGSSKKERAGRKNFKS